MPSDSELLAQINQKLTVLLKLMGATVGSDLSVAERAPLLSRVGLDRNSIAAICNTTAAAVSVRLAEAKRPTQSGAKRKRK